MLAFGEVERWPLPQRSCTCTVRLRSLDRPGDEASTRDYSLVPIRPGNEAKVTRLANTY